MAERKGREKFREETPHRKDIISLEKIRLREVKTQKRHSPENGGQRQNGRLAAKKA